MATSTGYQIVVPIPSTKTTGSNGAKMIMGREEPELCEKDERSLPECEKAFIPQEHARYLEGLEARSVTPLWTAMDRMVPPYPKPKAVPTSWEYSVMRLALMEASSIVPVEEAERRVLVLVNKALSAPYTTDTIYAGLQVVLPGEIAPAHRHRAFALRFIIEGAGGFTAVEGEKIEMHKGDVILTPSWQWHDHGNEGSCPIIWLDCLDLPLWQYMPINFVDQYKDPRYPSSPVANSALQIGWEGVAAELDAQESPHALYHYRHADGSHLSKTISAQAERVAAGHTTTMSQEILSYIYHVYDGQGFTTVKAPDHTVAERIEWVGKDSFAVPAWSEVSHTCTMEVGAAYLFAVNDKPMVEALTFLRKP